jgi:hypothetical protein
MFGIYKGINMWKEIISKIQLTDWLKALIIITADTLY